MFPVIFSSLHLLQSPTIQSDSFVHFRYINHNWYQNLILLIKKKKKNKKKIPISVLPSTFLGSVADTSSSNQFNQKPRPFSEKETSIHTSLQAAFPSTWWKIDHGMPEVLRRVQTRLLTCTHATTACSYYRSVHEYSQPVHSQDWLRAKSVWQENCN